MTTLQSLLDKRHAVLVPFPPEATVSEAVTRMAERQVGVVAILDHGRLVGVFSERDLLRRVVARGLSAANTPLRQVMTSDPATATACESREAAIARMKSRGCRHLPILDGDRLVDMLSMRDLLYAEIQDRDVEIRSLHEYIQGV